MQNRLEDLLQLMRDLRSPEHGCPWDKKQSFATLVPYTLEEAYEVVDAIERMEMEDIRLELGDLLFQVVFYAQIASEEGCFDFDAVIAGITEKLLRRHPHVFPEGTLASAGTALASSSEEEIRQNWEQIKQGERVEKVQTSLLDDVPEALSALMRAAKLQKRVAKVGFDWPDESGALAKVHEELAELEEAMASQQKERMTDELGDLLFSCVNLARHLEIEPEMALRGTMRKFEKRFRYLEAELVEARQDISAQSIEQLEAAWQRAKLRV